MVKKSVKLSDYINPHPGAQTLALSMLGKGVKLFYGGARGGGKSHMALDAAVKAAMRYPGIRVGVLRHTFPELNEVFITKLTDRFPETLFKYKYTHKDHTATFSNRSRIIFKSCENEKDAQKAQGTEYQLLIIDEVTNFEIEVVQKLFGSCRNAKIKNFKPTVMMTGNPGGISDDWFKCHYIDVDYTKWTDGELKHKDSYIFIPAKIADNPSVEEDYVAMLESLPEHLKKAWLDGDWNIWEGKFFDMWNQDIHVIPEQAIPSTWTIRAGMDLGYTEKHPTVCLWGAQNPDDGTVIVFDEYIGSGSVDQHLSYVGDRNYELGGGAIYADPSMWNKSTKLHASDPCPADLFLQSGIPVLPANNERINGGRLVKAWLNHGMARPPKLYVTDRCAKLITTLPTLKYAKAASIKEDLDTRMADDAADALRYLMMSGFGYPLEYNVPIDSREELRDVRDEMLKTRRGELDTYNSYRGYDFLSDNRAVRYDTY